MKDKLVELFLYCCEFMWDGGWVIVLLAVCLILLTQSCAAGPTRLSSEFPLELVCNGIGKDFVCVVTGAEGLWKLPVWTMDGKTHAGLAVSWPAPAGRFAIVEVNVFDDNGRVYVMKGWVTLRDGRATFLVPDGPKEVPAGERYDQ